MAAASLEIDIALALGGFRLEVTEKIALDGITALFGPSGSGKTSLLRVVAGLERQAAGRLVCGDDVWLDAGSYRPAHQRQIGYVFQDGRLFSHLDVRGNLLYPSRHGRRNGPIGYADVVAALDLEALLDRAPDSLSGGERQRVAIGRALLANPRLLLMDEPLSSVDIDRKREIVGLIETLPARFGLPIVYVTHDLDELLRLADRVIVLAGGRVAGHGEVAATLAALDPGAGGSSLDSSAVIEARVVLHGERLSELAIGDRRLRVPRIEAGVDSRVRLRIFARDVVIAAEPPGRISIRNVLPARVVAVDGSPEPFVDVRLDLGGQGLRARITRDACEELELVPGLEVYALIKSVALDAYTLR
jgi:molybdate transport system ATP-binding protein